MTDGIGRLSGYGNYGVGGYVSQKKGDVSQEETTQSQVTANNQEETQVDPAKVMEFLANNNYFIAAASAGTGEVDTATQDRIAGYMEQFEMIYGIVQEEFGEEMGPVVMDVVMDKLMGMTE